jgi:hypothetical protein
MSIIGNITTVPIYPGDLEVEGDFHIKGNLTVDMDSYVYQDSYTADPITIVNFLSGAPIAGVANQYAGIEIDRGTLTNYQIVFDESDDSVKIGEVGDLQSVATRQDVPTSNAFAYWNATDLRMDTNSLYTTSTMVKFSDLTVPNLSGALDSRYVNVTGDTMTGSLTMGTGTKIKLTDLSSSNLLTTDGTGDIIDSGIKSVSAPAGGSGIAVVEYPSAPTLNASHTGFIWVEAVDANTKKLCFYNGTDTFSVELTK